MTRAQLSVKLHLWLPLPENCSHFFLATGLLPAESESRVRLGFTIKDGSSAPLPDATILLLQHAKPKPPRPSEPDIPTAGPIARTGEDGRATVDVIKGQRYTVEVRAYGFQPWTKTGIQGRDGALEIILTVGFFVLF